MISNAEGGSTPEGCPCQNRSVVKDSGPRSFDCDDVHVARPPGLARGLVAGIDYGAGMVVPGFFLLIVLGLLSRAVQSVLRTWVHDNRARVFAGPLLLTGIFSLAAWNAGAFTI